jgi:purine-nucleoside phosphorylase
MSNESAAEIIRKACGDSPPRLGLILGSGLGALADTVENAKHIPYADLPGFPRPTVQGHEGQLVLGHLGGVSVAIMQGRAHYYEAGKADAMKAPIRSLQAAGCQSLLLTNAAGSLLRGAGPGSLMLITDHINFAGASPLIGETAPTKFVDLVDAYDPGYRAQLIEAARQQGVTLNEGVYMWFSGPNFETPAEIRAAKILGADAVGMSTVPEVILARHMGLKIAALSIITNYGAGLDDKPLSHAQTMEKAALGAQDLKKLLIAFLEGQPHE